MERTAFLMDRPSGCWDAFATKDDLEKLNLEFRTELHREMHEQTRWFATVVIGAMSVSIRLASGVGAVEAQRSAVLGAGRPADEQHRDDDADDRQRRVDLERGADAVDERLRRDDGGVEPEPHRATRDLEHVDDRAGQACP